ncbi:hypothetical protein DPEC_G00111070 [Dallia pectoralis]|uniref:Uncharacterized protein n=1 Tax=Dallia pectoralis TaxID=75939 RepID=A0ACC2GST7_DALPE|nr:hypothetical protein DPEC_G00111070 [Dallia pectoralis]
MDRRYNSRKSLRYFEEYLAFNCQPHSPQIAKRQIFLSRYILYFLADRRVTSTKKSIWKQGFDISTESIILFTAGVNNIFHLECQ